MDKQPDDLLALTPVNNLTPEQRHQRAMGWFVAEVYRQRANRQRMAKCEAYYDQYQYDQQTKADIEARGQYAVVFDRIAPQIDFLIGTERRTRIDFRVEPRERIDKESTTDAESKTKLLKWLDDTGDSAFERSEAFDDAMKAGLGWVEYAVDADHSGETPILERYVSWREIVHDSFGTRKDPRTMRYIFRVKCVDIDLAVAHFPKKREQILRVRQDAASLDSMTTWLNIPGGVMDLQSLFGGANAEDSMGWPSPMPNLYNARERVLLLECWSMEPVRQAPNGQPGGLNDPLRLRPYVSIMTEFDTLWEGWSPYKHDRYPFVPYWAYREKRTGLPYSPVRRAMDKQDALNGAMSRAHFEIATNQIVAEHDAFDDEVMTAEEAREEVDDPEGTVILKSGGMNKFEVRRGFDKAEAHMAMAERYMSALDEASAITRENTGRDSATTSGVARRIKQEQGSVMTAELFDNLLWSHKQGGEIKLALAEQFMLEPMAIPIPGERGKRDMLAINQPRQLPDGRWVWDNDISARKARFVISEQPWRASLAAAQFEELMELLTQLAPVVPQVVVALLDLVFEYADLPNKQSVLERIRSVTGQPGPDNQQTPEQQAAKQQQAALSQAQFDAQMAQLRATVREAEAKGEKLEAEAIFRLLESLYTAAQTAQVAQMNPGVAPITDEILKSVGFPDKHPQAQLAQAQAMAGAAPAGMQPPAAALQAPGAPNAPGPLIGHQAGIETPAADGGAVQPPMEQ